MGHRLVAAAVAAVVLAGCGGSSDRLDKAPPSAPNDLRVKSRAFGPGDLIPRKYTCDGAGVSPPLRWGGVPPAAAQLVLVVTDPDAPGGRFVHWTVYGLPPEVSALPEGAPTLVGAKQGKNSTGRTGWTPPCPPGGSAPHRYVFDLYWLKRKLNLGSGADANALALALKTEAGGRGELIGRYKRAAATKKKAGAPSPDAAH